jgi:hypothetical protein
MSRRSTAGTPVLVFSLVLAFVVGSFALAFATPLPAPQPNADPQIADCSKATDADITKAVIENINKRFKPEEIKAGLHFTVTCKNGVVEISGDAHGMNRKDPRGVRTTVTTIAQKTSCVKKVVTKHFTHEHPIKCAKTQKPCNGGCIEQNEECNPLIR